MATKVTGLGDNFYIAGYDVSGATSSLSKISGSITPLDYTDITQSAHARLGGVRDGNIDFTTYLDTSASGAHSFYSSLSTADVIANYFRGTTAGNPAAGMVAKQLNYDFTRAANGMLTANVHLDANSSGLEWGLMLTAGKRTDTSATAGSFYDNGAAFAFGAQAYLQVFSFTGTDVTVAVQHAATSGGSYSNIIPFAQITSSTPAAQRVTVSNTTTVNEFLKVTTTTTGGFSNLVFAVMINVNPLAGVVF
jgi:hypothetical protein